VNAAGAHAGRAACNFGDNPRSSQRNDRGSNMAGSGIPNARNRIARTAGPVARPMAAAPRPAWTFADRRATIAATWH
jgi:hypothetical protein